MRAVNPSRFSGLGCYKLHQALIIWLVILAATWACVSGHRTRHCKTNGINIKTNKGVRIEPYERSRVELPLGQPPTGGSNRLTFSFEFRTTSANGTLFYVRSDENPTELIGLVLRRGQLTYKFRCPSMYADVRLSTPHQTPVNDNRWHKVHFDTRFGRAGQRSVVKLDGRSQPLRYDMNCEWFTSLVIGGHSPEGNTTRLSPGLMGPIGHFEGCIKKMTWSHRVISKPKYYAVSQCE